MYIEYIYIYTLLATEHSKVYTRIALEAHPRPYSDVDRVGWTVLTGPCQTMLTVQVRSVDRVDQVALFQFFSFSELSFLFLFRSVLFQISLFGIVLFKFSFVSQLFLF